VSGASFHRRQQRAFSLVELLVVIGVISVLIAILLPVLAGAQRSARDVKCKSNMRQVAAALVNYAAENKGRFPPNIDQPMPDRPMVWQHWCDVDRIGKFVASTGVRTPSTQSFSNNYRNHVIGGVMACPSDEGGSASYAMNYFASSGVWLQGRVAAPNLPRGGQAWSSNAKDGSRLILLTEMFSNYADGHGGFFCIGVMPPYMQISQPPEEYGWWPGNAFVGYGRPFAYGTFNAAFGERYNWIDTHIDWGRHRRRGDGGTRYTEARGRANFAFADGHVAGFTPDELAIRATRRSRFVALWSPWTTTPTACRGRISSRIVDSDGTQELAGAGRWVV
jgi:prepilin-type processing-associated H-X9-DG protein/prepilin-type N-terminal cleavage/methylation domain-containing protein